MEYFKKLYGTFTSHTVCRTKKVRVKMKVNLESSSQHLKLRTRFPACKFILTMNSNSTGKSKT